MMQLSLRSGTAPLGGGVCVGGGGGGGRLYSVQSRVVSTRSEKPICASPSFPNIGTVPMFA